MTTVRYVSKIKKVKIEEHGRVVKSDRVIIYEELRDDEGNELIKIPSSLNCFLEKWKRTSINNAKNHADTVCAFLNYIKIQCEDGDDEEFQVLEKQGLYGLNFYHAYRFLDYCIAMKNIRRDTANQYTNRILDFYEFLLESDILDKKKVRFEYSYDKVQGSSKKRRRRKNPLIKPPYNLAYPSQENTKLRKLVNMDEHLWQLFIEVSRKHAPDITFGIALQISGGLRRGEVVNLTLHSIKRKRKFDKDESKMELVIQDRGDELFGDREDVNRTKCEVKKPRNQTAYNFDKGLYDKYEKHIQIRTKILAETGGNTTALFVDENGRAMSGERYEKRWAKVKREFIKVLKESVYAQHLEFLEMAWGTHIGRGIFTNLCLEYGLAKSARELANLRGDKGIDSSQPYIDEFNKRKIVIKSLNTMANDVGGF